MFQIVFLPQKKYLSGYVPYVEPYIEKWQYQDIFFQLPVNITTAVLSHVMIFLFNQLITIDYFDQLDRWWTWQIYS